MRIFRFSSRRAEMIYERMTTLLSCVRLRPLDARNVVSSASMWIRRCLGSVTMFQKDFDRSKSSHDGWFNQRHSGEFWIRSCMIRGAWLSCSMISDAYGFVMPLSSVLCSVLCTFTRFRLSLAVFHAYRCLAPRWTLVCRYLQMIDGQGGKVNVRGRPENILRLRRPWHV